MVWGRFTIQVAIALYWGVLTWLVYLALEPFVRRRWPDALISWMRLVAGRFKDPLVARDILIGCAGGIAIMFIGDIGRVLPEWLGQPPVTPESGGNALRSLGPVGGFIAEIVRRPSRILLESFGFLFVILLAHMTLRSRWAANAFLTVVIGSLVVNREALLYSGVAAIFFVAILVLLISRVGVLAFVSAWFVIYAMNDLPLSLDQSAWYAARSATTGGMIIVVAGWAFYHSFGERLPFGAAFD